MTRQVPAWTILGRGKIAKKRHNLILFLNFRVITGGMMETSSGRKDFWTRQKRWEKTNIWSPFSIFRVITGAMMETSLDAAGALKKDDHVIPFLKL
jgi:hypothetical protein